MYLNKGSIMIRMSDSVGAVDDATEAVARAIALVTVVDCDQNKGLT